jgi:light-regulated signal transduction histidine kinase (bacteriophytochrome)
VGDKDWARREGMVSFAGYPLLVGDHLVGVLAMFAKQPLTEADFNGLGTVANALAVGIARSRADAAIRARAEQLAQMAAALQRSNRDLDQFAYVASHDLKAPLRGIANLSQWIEEDLGDAVPESSREHLRLLRSRVNRMEALIDGVLAYSRAARTAGERETVAIGRVLRDVVDLISPPSNVEISVSPDLPTLTTHRLPLQQVFMNLITNAVKYAATARPDVRVVVSYRDSQGVPEFAVSDNGPGIDAAFHEKIWGIFQTLQPRDEVEGTGIGLALVKKIVEARGGRVWVESSAGHGATFRFTWPEAPAGAIE